MEDVQVMEGCTGAFEQAQSVFQWCFRTGVIPLGQQEAMLPQAETPGT